jgi:hypothetical protein
MLGDMHGIISSFDEFEKFFFLVKNNKIMQKKKKQTAGL